MPEVYRGAFIVLQRTLLTPPIMRMRASLALASLAFLAACQDTSAPTATDVTDGPQDQAKYHAAPAASRVSGEYIVVLRGEPSDDDVDNDARRRARDHGGIVNNTYHRAIRGYSITLNSQADAERIARDPGVAFVEEEQEYTASTLQSSATWGIDRVDQRVGPLSTTYSYSATASNVTAYIIDTGIRTAHTQFGGRATLGFNAFRKAANNGDCNGHGTHVAGTVGGSTYGIAKQVRLVAVRVLDCNGSGTTSGVIAGIDYVAGRKVASPGTPMVANMSLGGGASAALDNAVANAVAKGVVFAVAAGNSNTDACTQSPARAPSAITVGATTTTDARASYSNFGTCLDIFAPGSGITSAWNTSNTATATISGTSMASPHVAGVAALYVSLNPGASPATVASALVSNGTASVVIGAGAGSPNILLFTNY